MAKVHQWLEPSSEDQRFMRAALDLARKAAECGEVPVGAIVTRKEEIIGEGINSPIERCDPSAHAEVLALREAAVNTGNYRLPGTTLYVTLEPCMMCLGAIVHARVERVVFAADEPRFGALRECIDGGRPFNHPLLASKGVLAEEASAMLKAFFAERRK